MPDRHCLRRDHLMSKKRSLVHTQSLDSSRAFWPAGTKAIAKVKPSVAHSISSLDSNESKMNKVRIEAEEAKGRKDQDEGRGGRKGEDLSEDELPE